MQYGEVLFRKTNGLLAPGDAITGIDGTTVPVQVADEIQPADTVEQVIEVAEGGTDEETNEPEGEEGEGEE